MACRKRCQPTKFILSEFQQCSQRLRETIFSSEVSVGDMSNVRRHASDCPETLVIPLAKGRDVSGR